MQNCRLVSRNRPVSIGGSGFLFLVFEWEKIGVFQAWSSFRTLQGDEFGPCVDDDDDLGNEFALDEDRLVKQVASSSNQPQYGSAGLSGHGSARDLREDSVTPVPQSPQVRA